MRATERPTVPNPISPTLHRSSRASLASLVTCGDVTKPRLLCCLAPCRHLHIIQPPCRKLVLASNCLGKCALQPLRHRARLAPTDLAEINLAQPDHLGSRTRHKDFIGEIQLVPRNRLLRHAISQIAR